MRHRAFSTYPLFETPVRWDNACLTNSDFTEELVFTIGDDPLDLVSHDFDIQIRTAPNANTAIKSLGTVSSATSEGIYPVEPENGMIQIRVNRDSLLSLYQSIYHNSLEGDCVSLYYDLLATLPNGDKEAWLMGYFNIRKAITDG